MDKYVAAKAMQLDLFRLYHAWFDELHLAQSQRTDFRVLFKAYPRIVKSLRTAIGRGAKKKVLYGALRRAAHHKRQAWRYYVDATRFGFVCVAMYRQTNVDFHFAKARIMAYLRPNVV